MKNDNTKNSAVLNYAKALNYSTACFNDLSNNINRMLHGHREDSWRFLYAKNLEHGLLKLLDESVKFILPENGQLLSLDQDGNENNEKLFELFYSPFDIVAFEYPISCEATNSKKKITLLFDCKSDNPAIRNIIEYSDAHRELLKEDFNINFSINASQHILDRQSDRSRIYGIITFLSVANNKWQHVPAAEMITINDDNSFESHPLLFDLIMHDNISKQDKKNYRELFESYKGELLFDVDAAKQALLVLNCENIKKIDLVVPEKIKKYRTKKGLLPLYDYKVLTVFNNNSKKYNVLVSQSDENHSSKRAHFRRGHLRRLKSKKVVYVRSTVVGSSDSHNFLNKDYSLE